MPAGYTADTSATSTTNHLLFKITKRNIHNNIARGQK